MPCVPVCWAGRRSSATTATRSTTGSGSTTTEPIALGNIDTLQNFVHLYDEHWFILVHVEIEAIAARILAAIEPIGTAAIIDATSRTAERRRFATIAAAIGEQVTVLRRIPEKMDPALYYRTFRPYIRFFENVVYEGVIASADELSRRDRRTEQHHADASSPS